ncbi:hypothetical protein [Pseudorhodobacter ferrugineus]|uniref:hypothetical protein n=1 Tax=Pseudorhodobacter ferrugineus TaxID=77008 RepID=UPI00040B377D|nr:hypothetical protein [Pseudorhodobacter ferrugineus]
MPQQVTQDSAKNHAAAINNNWRFCRKLNLILEKSAQPKNAFVCPIRRHIQGV